VYINEAHDGDKYFGHTTKKDVLLRKQEKDKNKGSD